MVFFLYVKDSSYTAQTLTAPELKSQFFNVMKFFTVKNI